MRILVCDDLHPAALEVFRARGLEVEVKTGMTEDALVEAVPGVRGLVVRSATKITRRVLEAADALEVVGRAGVGVDNVDTNAASERGVIVMNTPTGNTTTTGELALALLLSLARHIPRADSKTRSGEWKKKGLMGTEITGKTLGVVGLGRIGRVVAERGQGLRMNVLAHDPYVMQSGAGSPIAGVELCELDDLLGRCDFVTLHVPLVESTRNLISAERIALMKPGARLVNAARGGLVDEEAVARALDEGRLAGAAFDVLSQEPPAGDHPLVGRDDVILTPHLGASSEEAQRNVAVQVADQISDWFADGVAHNAVNAPALPAQTLRELGPLILLTEKMGRFLGQRASEPIKKVELSFSGEVATRERDYLELSFLTAVLAQAVDGVNFVNAPIHAKERGLKVLSSADEDAASAFKTLVKARVSCKGGSDSHLVSGTMFGDKPRFTRIDGVHVDIEPKGTILITAHRDRPGVLGHLGTVLGGAGINIHRAELGPATDESDGLASCFLRLDATPNDDVIAGLRAYEPMVSVEVVEL